MYQQGALAPLPQRPSDLNTSHQSSINTGQITIAPQGIPPMNYRVKESDLQKVRKEAAAFDLTNLLRVLGTLDEAQKTKQTTFNRAADLVPPTCRQQQQQAQSGGNAGATGVASSADVTSDPEFT